MWQTRSPFLACFCWLLMTEITDSDNTVYATLGSQSVLPCPLTSVINNTKWIGPPGNTLYNLEGTNILNVAALPADFVSRLAVNTTTGALIINNTQWSDGNVYICEVRGNVSRVILTILVTPQPPFIANTLEDNGLGRMVVWAKEENRVSLVCQIMGGNPQPLVKWIRGGVTGSEVLANNSVKSNTNGTYDVISTLTIMANRYEDRVTYVCQAERRTWTSPQNASLELYLYLKPRYPFLSEQGSLQEGENLSVKCSVSECRPVVNLIWTGLQGQQIQTNTWIPEDETYNVTSLYTKTVIRQDNGVILQCTITHTALRYSLNASTTVVVWFPPTNVNITDNREVTAGRDTLILRCTTGTSNPIADISWRNGTNAPAGELSTKMEQPGAYGGKIQYQDLTITPTRYMDRSIITCSALNSQTTEPSVSDNVILSVMYNPFTVISNGSTVSVKEGDTNVTMMCTAESKPVSSFTWIKDTVTLNATGPKSDNRDSYTIYQVDRTHYGEYSCIANNGISPNGQETVSIYVMFPPTDVRITNNKEVTAGQVALILRCTTGTSYPVANISWRNGTSAPTGELSTKMEQPGEYGGKIQYQDLTITPTRYMDGNTITCSSLNSQTTGPSISDSVILNVRFSPIVQVSITRNLTFTEGDNQVTIRCSASSKPISYFTLRKEGLTTAISEGSGSQDNHYEYIIQRINRTYAGRYSCSANNGVVGPQDEVNATLDLVVQYPPTVDIESRNGSYNETGLMIKCSAHGVPARYSHRLTHRSMFSGIEIRQVSYESISGGVIIHQFTNPSYMDTGIYTCSVNNGIPDYRDGSFDKSVSITIWIKGPPSLTSREISFSSEIGQSGRLVIEFYNSLLDPLVTWYKYNGGTLEKLLNSDKYNTILASAVVNVNFYSVRIQQPGFVATLEVRNVTEEDLILYQVHVQNYIGEMSPLILELKASASKPQDKTNNEMNGLIIGSAIGSTVFTSIVVAAVGVLLYRKRNAFNKDNQTTGSHTSGSINGSTGKTECSLNNEREAKQYLELQHIDREGGENLNVRSSKIIHYEVLCQREGDEKHAYSFLSHGEQNVYENTNPCGNSIISCVVQQEKC